MNSTGTSLRLAVALGLAALAFAHPARAQQIDTIDFAPDNVSDGMGTGTLANGAITVTYTTENVLNSGITFVNNYAASLATNDAVGAGLTHNTAGGFGSSGTSTATIAFSAPVVDPTLFLNFTDPGGSLVFTNATLTLLDNNNTQ